MVIMLLLIIFCCYRVTVYYLPQAWTWCNYFVLQLGCFASGCIKDRVFTVYEVLFHRTLALQTPFYLRFSIRKFTHPNISHRMDVSVGHFARGRFGERWFTLIPSIFPPFSCSPNNVDIFQAWLNQYLSHATTSSCAAKVPMAIFHCCLAREYLSTEYILRVDLEINKIIRFVSIILTDPHTRWSS